MTKLDAALAYLADGHRPIPIENKAPTVPWKQFQGRLPTEAEVRAWWSTGDPDIALVLGPHTGLVIDVDGPRGYQSLLKHPAFPDTKLTRTPRGWHYWFRHPGVPVRSRVGLFPGVDVRADRSYVVVVPSAGYLAAGTPLPAELPGWLREHLIGAGPTSQAAEVAAWLERILSRGPQRRKAVEAEIIAGGVKRRVLQAAKQLVKLQSYQDEHGRTMWAFHGEPVPPVVRKPRFSKRQEAAARRAIEHAARKRGWG